jgi:hypothetical protein
MARSMMKIVIQFAYLLAVCAVSQGVKMASVTGSNKQLKCYQCQSNSSSDVLPLCDNSFWKLTTEGEKLSLESGCPSKQAHYCFKAVSWKNDSVLTHRGCQGLADKWGTVLGQGCMHMKEENVTVCLCGTDLCNHVNRGPKSTPFLVFGLALFILFIR